MAKRRPSGDGEDIAGTIRPSTMTRYQSTVRNHLVPHLGDEPVSQVTPKDVQRLYDELSKSGNMVRDGGLASGSIKGIHNMFHEALKAAQQARCVTS